MVRPGRLLTVATYEQAHAGDIVLGHDGELWGVLAIDRVPQLAVTLVKGVQRVVGYPPQGTPVTVVIPADVAAEARAAQVFMDAGFTIEIVHEHV
jgi:hypothetical protein